MYNVNLKSKNVLIVGFGKSGSAAAEVADSLGANIFVYDSKSNLAGIHSDWKTYLGGVEPGDKNWDLVIMSPGVSLDAEFIKRIIAQGTPVIGELEFAYQISQGEFIAITGTNGKTTTTALVGEIFKEDKRDTRVVGNIGDPVATEACQSNEDTYLITEVSSFQLEAVDTFKPHIASVLNITPDHLDRHITMDNYRNTKARIFENQTKDDFLILNYDDLQTRNLSKIAKAEVVYFSRKTKLEKGVYIDDSQIVVNDGRGNVNIVCSIEDLKMPGEHNLENALAAVATAYFSGISKDAISSTLKKFPGVANRLEFVDEVQGVRFVNDSKGTNPEASINAIKATKPRIFLIAGGYEKNADYTELIESFDGKVAYILLIGQTAQRIKARAHEMGFEETIVLDTMEECVRKGFEFAWPGDTVLLSPASASWDMYDNYEMRGDDFRRCVNELKKEN